MTTSWTIGADAADPQRLAAFWAYALGYVPEPGFDGPDVASLIDPQDRLPAVSFLRVPEGKTAKNRFHLDLRVGGFGDDREERIRAKVAELEAAGASTVRAEHYDGGFGHVVMLDPEGNEFCVA